jgi:hypothetical protein
VARTVAPKTRKASKAPSAAQLAARERFAAAAKARHAAKAGASDLAARLAKAEAENAALKAAKGPTVRKAAAPAAPPVAKPAPAAPPPAAPGTTASNDAAILAFLAANPKAKTPDVIRAFKVSVNRAAALVGQARGAAVKVKPAESARTVEAPAASLDSIPMDF